MSKTFWAGGHCPNMGNELSIAKCDLECLALVSFAVFLFCADGVIVV